MFEDIVWLLDNSLFYGVKEKLRRCCEKKLTPTVVLTAGVLFVGEGGLEPPNSSEDRFTVCCNCRYATPPWFCVAKIYNFSIRSTKKCNQYKNIIIG